MDLPGVLPTAQDGGPQARRKRRSPKGRGPTNAPTNPSTHKYTNKDYTRYFLPTARDDATHVTTSHTIAQPSNTTSHHLTAMPIGTQQIAKPHPCRHLSQYETSLNPAGLASGSKVAPARAPAIMRHSRPCCICRLSPSERRHPAMPRQLISQCCAQSPIFQGQTDRPHFFPSFPSSLASTPPPSQKSI